MSCLAFSREGCGESLAVHVRRVLAVWDMLRPLYARTARRAVDAVGFDPVEYAIVAHDLGKLAGAYQRGQRGAYRHEVVSAYLAYKGLGGVDEDARVAVAAAVLLHHEPIIMSAYVAEVGEDYLPVYVLRRELERSNLKVECDWGELRPLLEGYPGLYKAVEQWAAGGLEVGDVLGVLKRVLVLTSIGDVERAHIMRARVGAVLYPLVVADSVAAHIGREVCERCGGEGTRIAEWALGGAEPLKRDEVVEKVCRVGRT